METIISALITGGLALLGVIVSSYVTANKVQKQLEIAQAVTEAKITELTREVREHNNFAQRVPVLETKYKIMETKVDSLEKYHKQPIN